jgi:hypothetical protein
MEFADYVAMGREIEFTLKESNYFISPVYDSKFQTQDTQFQIYDCDNEVEIFVGTLDKLMSFIFKGKYSLKDNLDMFSINYIL